MVTSPDIKSPHNGCCLCTPRTSDERGWECHLGHWFEGNNTQSTCSRGMTIREEAKLQEAKKLSLVGLQAKKRDGEPRNMIYNQGQCGVQGMLSLTTMVSVTTALQETHLRK